MRAYIVHYAGDPLPFYVKVKGLDYGRFRTCTEAVEYLEKAQALYAEECEAFSAQWFASANSTTKSE